MRMQFDTAARTRDHADCDTFVVTHSSYRFRSAFETAITPFLALGRRLQEVHPLTRERVLNELTASMALQSMKMLTCYCSNGERRDHISFLSQRICVHVATLPLAQEVRFLDFTRQVFVTGEDE